MRNTGTFVRHFNSLARNGNPPRWSHNSSQRGVYSLTLRLSQVQQRIQLLLQHIAARYLTIYYHLPTKASSISTMDFVSLRSYLEGSRRPTTAHPADATTLSTCSDEGTAVSPSPMCSFEDTDRFCNVFDSIQPFPGCAKPLPQPAIAMDENLKIVSTMDDKIDLPRVEPKTPRTRTLGEVKQLQPSVMYADRSVGTLSKDSSKKPVIEPKRHWQWWGHGKIPTFIALLLAWAGCMCAVACRSSTDFVILREPFYVAPVYEPLTRVGMIRMKLCFNETMSDMTGCEIIRLSPPEVEDRMFNIARSLLTLATCLGCGLTLVLTTSVVWESINLRPLGFAFVLTYLLQSFSLFFFGSKLCNEHRCRMSQGSILCIVTCMLWIGVSFAVFKMDVFKFKAQRQRRREARRKRRQERRDECERQMRAEALAQMMTSMSTDTEDTNPTAIDLEAFDMEEATVATTEAVNGSPVRKK